VCQALQLEVSKIRSFALFLWSTVAGRRWPLVPGAKGAVFQP